MMELLLNDLAVDCIIGERADERNRAQRLRVDVALKVEGKVIYNYDRGEDVPPQNEAAEIALAILMHEYK